MFTIQQIKDAHSKVKSGADFPAYIRDIRELGVHHYATFVADGISEYYDRNGQKVSGAAKYDAMQVAGISNEEQFKADLKAHQQGKTDFLTFCRDCARSGIEKWVVDIEAMTCTYYDKAENKILEETIPG